MKALSKIAMIDTFLAVLSGCTGTTYNATKDCTMDYLLHPKISVPALINACDSK